MCVCVFVNFDALTQASDFRIEIYLHDKQFSILHLNTNDHLKKIHGPRLNKKDGLSRYGDFHYKDTAVVIPFFFIIELPIHDNFILRPAPTLLGWPSNLIWRSLLIFLKYHTLHIVLCERLLVDQYEQWSNFLLQFNCVKSAWNRVRRFAEPLIVKCPLTPNFKGTFNHLGPLLLTWINFDSSMDK